MDEHGSGTRGPSPAQAGAVTLFFGVLGFFLGSLLGQAGAIAGSVVFAVTTMGMYIIEAINSR